jgi:hypothetical protein
MGQPEVAQETDSGTVVHAAWWEEFNDPQLTRFVLLALEQNLGIEQASARVMQARAGLGMANAALLPSGAVNGQAARAYQSIETPVGRLLNENPGYNRWGSAYEADLTASWEIDLFGGLRRSREAAQAEYQAAEAGVAASRLAVAAQRLTSPSGACRFGLILRESKSEPSRSYSPKSNCFMAKGWRPNHRCNRQKVLLLRTRQLSLLFRLDSMRQ